jgi:acyl-CoA thioesterase I
MSKKGWAALLFLTACENPFPAPPPPTGASVKPDLRLLALGDSLTAGKDLEDPEAQAYPAVLERLLREKGYNVAVTNAGLSGDTTADVLARLDWSLAEKPDIVLVALGSNDTFQGKKLPDIEKNIERILRRAEAAGAVTVLALLKTFPNLGPSYGDAYEKMFARLAERTGSVLAPFLLEGVAGDPSLNLPDGIHPNAEGHRRAAKTLLPAIEESIKKRRSSS